MQWPRSPALLKFQTEKAQEDEEDRNGEGVDMYQNVGPVN